MQSKKIVIGVIPARFKSSRFPGKPLAKICGKPMIQWVYNAAKKAKYLDQVIVATDDLRILKTVKSFNGTVEMTSSYHNSGTERIGEIALKYPADLYLNIQSDEPLISSYLIDNLVKFMLNNPRFGIGTVKSMISLDSEEYSNPNVVKVVTDKEGKALYFSRASIPFKAPHIEHNSEIVAYKHIGIYAFTADALKRFLSTPPSALEKIESLEQLRAFDAGIEIGVFKTDEILIGVDTPDDLKLVEKYILANEEVFRAKFE